MIIRLSSILKDFGINLSLNFPTNLMYENTVGYMVLTHAGSHTWFYLLAECCRLYDSVRINKVENLAHQERLRGHPAKDNALNAPFHGALCLSIKINVVMINHL